MPAVTVKAIKSFEYKGRMIRAGEPVEIDPPVQVSIMARQGLVSLSKYSTKDMSAADPEPKPEQRRRRYRRRDMQADQA